MPSVISDEDIEMEEDYEQNEGSQLPSSHAVSSRASRSPSVAPTENSTEESGGVSSTISSIVHRLQKISKTVPDLEALERKKKRLESSKAIAEHLLEKKKEASERMKQLREEEKRINGIIDLAGSILMDDQDAAAKAKKMAESRSASPAKSTPASAAASPQRIKSSSLKPSSPVKQATPLDNKEASVPFSDSVSEAIEAEHESSAADSIPMEIEVEQEDNSLASVAESIRLEEDEVQKSIDDIKLKLASQDTTSSIADYSEKQQTLSSIAEDISSFGGGHSGSLMKSSDSADEGKTSAYQYDDESFETVESVKGAVAAEPVDISLSIDLEEDEELSGKYFYCSN
jgi:hypothetical protein